MRDGLVLMAHLIVTIIKVMAPGGARTVVAESLLLKHQLLILNRSRRKAPPLRALDRILLGLARSRRTRWSNAIRAVLHNCIPTGESSALRLAIRLFRPLSHANCRVIRNSPWSRCGVLTFRDCRSY
jgi:hypothetical protein